MVKYYYYYQPKKAKQPVQGGPLQNTHTAHIVVIVYNYNDKTNKKHTVKMTLQILVMFIYGLIAMCFNIIITKAQ